MASAMPLQPAKHAALAAEGCFFTVSSFVNEHLIRPSLDDTAGLQDFPRQPGDWDPRDAIDCDPCAFRGAGASGNGEFRNRLFRNT